MSKTVLVTGGAGFIGSNLIRWILSNRDWRVVNLDALTYAGNLANLRDVESDQRYRFVHGRIEDAALVHAVLEEHHIEGIIHCAAESHVDRSIAAAAPFIETNVRGTLVLLEAARQHGIERFIHVSTDEVYGTLGPDDPPFTEESPLAPNSPYAASKAGADCLVRAFVHTYGLPAIITRCSNNYGPYQFPESLSRWPLPMRSMSNPSPSMAMVGKCGIGSTSPITAEAWLLPMSMGVSARRTTSVGGASAATLTLFEQFSGCSADRTRSSSTSPIALDTTAAMRSIVAKRNVSWRGVHV